MPEKSLTGSRKAVASKWFSQKENVRAQACLVSIILSTTYCGGIAINMTSVEVSILYF